MWIIHTLFFLTIFTATAFFRRRNRFETSLSEFVLWASYDFARNKHPRHRFILRRFFREIARVFLAKRHRTATGNRSANMSVRVLCAHPKTFGLPGASVASKNRYKKHHNLSSIVNIFSGVSFEKIWSYLMINWLYTV